MKKDSHVYVSGEKLRFYRSKKKGLNQNDLADIAGITRPRYSDWEKMQEIKLEIEVAEAIAKKLEVSVNDLTDVKTSFDDKSTQDQPEEIYRNIVEGNTEYILIPRTVLQEKYRLVSIEQIEKEKAQLEKDRAYLDGQFGIIQQLMAQIDKLNTKPPDVQKA